MDGTLETHAHVTTGVEDTVHVVLVADDALCLDHGWVRRTGLWSGLQAGVGPAGSTKSGSWLTRMNSHNLDLLGHAVEVDERPGGERDVGGEQETLGSSIDRAEDGSVQREAEGEFVSVLRIGEDVLGVDPVLLPLG